MLLVCAPWIGRLFSRPEERLRVVPAPAIVRHEPVAPIEGHEQSDANWRWIVGVVLGLLLFGLALHWILAGFLGAMKQSPTPKDAWRPVQLRTQPTAASASYPRLQVAPPLDLQSFRAREQTELATYGWINRTAGVVRVPIERAMDLVLKQRLPTRGSSNTNQTGPSSYQLIQQRPEHREPIQGEK